MLRILFLGDIVGEPGRTAFQARAKEIKTREEVDFLIVNGENAAGGRGITPKISIDLLRAGAAVITTGDHVWDQKEVVDYLETEPRLLRPLNYPVGTPGSGSIVLETEKGAVGVICVQARSFTMPHLENPFLALESEVEEMRKMARVIFVDAHGETTSEKTAIARLLDGKVSAVIGTHTHVPTADEQIFPGGTAFQCDAGMCGPSESILGRDIDSVISRFRTSMPRRMPVAKGLVHLNGILVDVDEGTGHAVAVRRFREEVPPRPTPWSEGRG